MNMTDLKPSGSIAVNSLYSAGATMLFEQQMAFMKSRTGDSLAITWEFTVQSSFIDIAESFRAIMPEGTTLHGASSRAFALIGPDCLIHLQERGASNDDPWDVVNRNIYLQGLGDPQILRAVMTRAKAYPRIKNPRIRWNYMSENKRMEAVVFAEPPRVIHDAYYPFIKEGFNAFVERYRESTASILLLRGDPGTGKTSFIQNLLWAMNTDAMITYEERLFHSDEMFVTFLTEDASDLLIMEDADVMLLSREQHGNQIMAKFLNVADGLIRFPKKKIIISSNLIDERKIDSALLRPGRCFPMPAFRRLTYNEACTAAEVAGRTPPAENREYTLAEVMNEPEQRRANNVVGFGRH